MAEGFADMCWDKVEGEERIDSETDTDDEHQVLLDTHAW